MTATQVRSSSLRSSAADPRCSTEIVGGLIDSFRKLDPRVQIRNPVMFVVEIGAVITTVAWLIQVFGGKPLGGGNEPAWFTFTVAVWLWLTVVFANLAEALAEGRGRAQAASAARDAHGDRRAPARRREQPASELVQRRRRGGRRPAS